MATFKDILLKVEMPDKPKVLASGGLATRPVVRPTDMPMVDTGVPQEDMQQSPEDADPEKIKRLKEILEQLKGKNNSILGEKVLA